MLKRYDFYKTKYGGELLIDLIPLKSLSQYIRKTPSHSLSYYDITVITEGNGSFSIDGHHESVTQGKVLFSAPGQVRAWKYDTIPNGWVLLFESDFLCEFFNDTQFVRKLPYFYAEVPAIQLNEEEYHEIIPILENIYREITTQKDKHILRALLYHITMLLNRSFIFHHQNIETKLPNHYIQLFQDLVEKYYPTQRHVEFYADKLHITSGHLNDIIKHDLGLTAKQFILDRTMQEAKRLLEYTDLSIDAIAQQLNYENTSYFVRAFYNKVKQTPLRFREDKLQIR